MRRFLALFCCAVLTLCGAGAKAEQVSSSAKAAVVIELETGRVLLAYNEQTPLPMASTTKVMTALLALEYGKLDEVVTASRNAYGVPGTSIYLGLGEQVVLRDLLYGLMLASGNDAAVAIAEHIGGDVDSFCQRMTQRAVELGCENTAFVTPHGLPAKEHYTTAKDLAFIAREAMTHPLFREIVSTRRASIPWAGRSYPRILTNKNRLLTDYTGATGIKTGYTRAAGRCLVFGAKREGLEVVGVVLNCSDWFGEAARLMDQAFAAYETFCAFEVGETVRELPVIDGMQETVCIRTAERLAAPVHKSDTPILEIDLPDSITAGRLQGEAVGEARLVLDGEILDAAPLVLGETLDVSDFGYSLQKLLRHWPVQPQSMAQ